LPNYFVQTILLYEHFYNWGTCTKNGVPHYLIQCIVALSMFCIHHTHAKDVTCATLQFLQILNIYGACKGLDSHVWNRDAVLHKLAVLTTHYRGDSERWSNIWDIKICVNVKNMNILPVR